MVSAALTAVPITAVAAIVPAARIDLRDNFICKHASLAFE
jgi:hypothetical protein